MFEGAPRSGINFSLWIEWTKWGAKIDHASCLLGLVHRDPEGHENYISASHSYKHERINGPTYDSASMTGAVKLTKGSHVWVKVLMKDGDSKINVDRYNPTGIAATFTGVRVGS